MCAQRRSFERFGDDLCEVIVSKLFLVDKIALECVSKQWQRCLFQRQTILELNGSRSEANNTVNVLLNNRDDNEYNKQIENLIAFEKLLKKCPFISKLKFSHDIDVNDNLVRIIGNNCRNVTSIEFNFYNISEALMKEFGDKCGQQLRRILINRFGSNAKMKSLLKLCANVAVVHNAKIVDLIEETSDQIMLPRLVKVRQLFKSEKSAFMEKFVRAYAKQLTSFGTNPNANIMPAQQNVLMKHISMLSELTELKLEFNFENGFSEQFGEHLKAIAVNCKRLERLDLQLFDLSLELKQQASNSLLVWQVMTAICHFVRLVSLKLDIDQSPDTVQRDEKISAKCFESCKKLTHLSLNCPLMSDSFFEGIDKYAPQLTSFSVVVEEEISDKSMACLAKLPNLKRITFKRTLLKYNFPLITDAGVCELIDNCPNIESMRFTARPNITHKSIESMIRLARKNAKINYRHFFGSVGRESNATFSEIDMKRYATSMPSNLHIVVNNHYQHDIQEFKRFLNLQ